MATLRDRILNNPSALPAENVEGMGDFRQGLRNALIGAEANTALAEEASARAAGDAATADARAQRVNLLRAQQGMTPLRVGRVEDITGVGDAIDWAAGQLGNAAGSMAAPVAGATATAGLGSLLSLAPNAGVRALGRGLRTFGTPAVPFAINAEQMKGEFYGNAKDDPTIMANTSAGDLNNTANLVGAAGGALDAILPTAVARSVAGAGLRQGLRGGGAGRIVGNSLMEGGTELAQGELGRQVRGVLNPEQDTSGFASDRLNEFASGAVGGAPFAAAGEMADAGWRRVGDTASRAADAAGQVAGQVVDLGQSAVERAKERGTEMFGAARGKVVDLKEQLKERTSQAKSQWEATQEEIDLIMGNPPEGMENAEAFTQWWTQNSGRRAETIMSRLNEMAAAGDEQAGAMLADIEAARNDPNDDGSYDAALDNASEHVLSSMRLSNVAQAAARSGAEAVATKAKDIMASLGKAAWGATLGRKRNAQGGQVDPQADAALELMGNYLATATRPELTRYAVAKGDKSIPNYMRRLGNELSAMAHAGVAVDGKALLHLNRMANHMVGAYGPRAMEVVRELAAMAPPQGAPLIDALVGQVETAAGRAGARATLTLRRQAADALLTALPAEAEQKLLKEGVNLRSDEGKRQLLGMVEALAMGRATPDARGALERLVGAEAVVDMIQAIQPAAQETETDAVMFEGQAGEMLTENGLEVTDDGDVIDGEVPSDYAERAAEKNFAKGSGPTYYGFARRPTLNNSQEARDPFGYTERLTKDQMRERLSSGKELPRRPELFKKGETLASGESAAQARAEAMARRLGESRFDIRERRVSEVMDELGLEPVKRLQLFRDYMIQEAQKIEASEGRTEAAEAMRNASKLARAYLLDIMDGVAGGERKAEKFRTTPKEREFVRRQADRYFQTRFMIVAEPMTDQVPEELTPANLKRFASRADAAIASMEVKARKQGLTGEAKDKFVSGEMARENVLEFEPVGGKRKVLYVKADDLVKWARAQRQSSTQSDFSKADTRSETARDREYVSDLMVGVSAMVSSGGVKGLPKLGVQSFENDVPAGLVLPSGRRFANLKAPEVNATTSEEAVAEEQDRDWFVVDDSPPEESSFQAERSEEEALNRAQLRFQNRGSKSETRSARSRDTLRKLTAEERRERMTSGETREGELDAAFDDQRYRSGTQGFDPTRGRRPVAEDAARATTTPRDLSTPRKFLTELQAFAEATRKLVTGAPDVLSDDPDVAGRYGAKSKRQAAGVIEARKKEFEQFTEALAGFMMDSPFTEKQDALITRLTTEIGNDLGLTSAEEAGARLGKPSGGVYPNRLSELGAKLTDPNLSKFRDRAFTELNKLRGMPAQELYESEPVQALLDELGAMRLRGEDITSYAGALEYTLDTITSANLGAEVEASVTALIAGGTKNTLRRYLAGFSTDPDTPPQIKRIAKAVAMVAGNVEVRVGPLAEGMAGAFDSSDQGGGHIIMTPEDVGLGRAATLLHEGVHAATVAALWKNPALHQAVYDLMEHVGKADPQLGQQYGMTNTLEFVAEGMSNIAFQERLAGVSASSAVQRYLGKTVANAWDAFVGLVKEALGLSNTDVNALTQLLELTGRAMKATPKTGVVTTDLDRGYGVLRERVPTSTVLEYIEKMKKAPVVWEDEARGALRAVEEHLKTQDMWDHQTALGIATAEASVRIAPKGSVISGENIVKVLDSIENVIAGSMYMVPNRAPGKRNAQSVQIHNDLGRSGFAATHDSPIRHAGKFDWRAHQGKGEGNAAFGAGTYLSTGDKVHSFYKAQFTEQAVSSMRPLSPEARAKLEAKLDRYKDDPNAAELRDAILEDLARDDKARRSFAAGASPTYQVSVDIAPDQLMDWDKPMNQQSPFVQKALKDAGVKTTASVKDIATGREVETVVLDGAAVYMNLAKRLGSQAKASDYLQSLGILGHKYAASNGRDGTTPNYVIYDDSKIVTNYVHFNAQTTAGGSQSTPEAQAEARDYIKRVLGPKIKVEFKKLTGYAGEWVEAENAIYISTTPAPGTMQVAYHEALHAFFSKWVSNDQNAKDVLQELADNQAVMRRVRDLIGNDPAALAQLVDGEERLAYIYQFWAAGALQLPYTKPTTLLRKVTKFLRRVAGMVTDTERAVAIFEALHRGDFGKGTAPGAKAMQDALQQGMTSRKVIRKMDRLVQRAAALTLPAESILKNSASKSAQRIGELFFVNPGDDGTGKEAGYLNAREQMTRRYVNEFSRTLDGLQESDYKAVGDYLSRGVELDDITSDIHRRAVKDIRALLKRFRQYMVDERGVDIGDLGDKYYPRVWSLDKLMEKQAEFLKMMATKYPERDGPTILGILTENTASDIEAGRPRNEDGVLTPLNRSGEERVFAWMDPADAAPFLETNMVGVLTRYFHEGVRAAEYTYRFGQKGQKLQELLAKTDNELYLEGRKLLRQGVLANEKAADDWHERQLRDVREAVGAMEGTLGKDISAGWRATNSWVTVYQNIRLLPLSLFASIVDPMGMIARGAEMSEAYEAFKRGMVEVGRQWRDVFKEQPTKRQADEWERLAQYVGSVDAAMFESQVGDMYSSVYMSPTAKKWNDTFFKLNGMEAWNRGMRIGATKAAVQFIQRHSTLPTKDSQRWLDELGLQKGDVVLDADGKLLVAVGDIAKAKGISREQAREVAHRLHAGINRWVTGAVLTPNAAQRPAWSSDPHYSMFFHLKQFTYSFHQTILKRAVREGAQGNIAPMMSLFWYVPIMVGADLIKGVIQGGGELPTHMKGMDAGEWLMYGVERSGIMGLGTLGVDAQDDLASLGGPMVEQIVDAFGDPLERTAIKAMPANPLYREALI